jgi:clathrin heavy chain
VVGRMQLYSVEKGVSQIVEGHAATFVNFKFESNPSPFVVLSFAVRGSQGDKVQHILQGELV